MSHPFPPEMVARARGIADGTITAPEPRDAATVVLVRDGETGLEVWLLRRVRTMVFAAGAYVFPGGKVDPADDGGDGLPPAWADSFCDGDTGLLRRVVGAAIRETEEECGVIVTAADLRPFAHWVTPVIEPRRYDTRFLLAALPEGQEARVNDGESDEGRWFPLAEALDQPMLPPTRAVIVALQEHADVASALAATPTITRIVPALRQEGDTWRLVMETS
ncbi:MAG: NUDIX hydrolase [Mycobacteriales bacterium]